MLELVFVPIALALIAIWFNQQSSRTSSELVKEQFNDTALQKYFDDLSELIMDRNLFESKDSDPARTLAWLRTVAATRTLDEKRKAILLDFLYYSNMIYKKGIIGLYNADFSNIVYKNSFLTQTNLRGAIFENANLANTRLREADLEKANLRNSILDGSDLINANLQEADLTGASIRDVDLFMADLYKAKILDRQLKDVKSLSGAIMPDGKIYDGRYGFRTDIKLAKACEVNVSNKNEMILWYQNARSEIEEQGLYDINSFPDQTSA